MFKSYIGKIKAAVGENKTEIILSISIFLVCSGSNDIANTYFSTPFRRANYDIPAYTDLINKLGWVGLTSSHLTRLIKHVELRLNYMTY